jgi:hypothetical protein
MGRERERAASTHVGLVKKAVREAVYLQHTQCSTRSAHAPVRRVHECSREAGTVRAVVHTRQVR